MVIYILDSISEKITDDDLRIKLISEYNRCWIERLLIICKIRRYESV